MLENLAVPFVVYAASGGAARHGALHNAATPSAANIIAYRAFMKTSIATATQALTI
ncbi:hypothetical protein [Paraburkholderia dipogonis]|uniref:hypothetical protein n=1 Tax=Paraburkholderia dipogonis TaxID=1211383 RepID=UPI0038BDEE18